MNADIQRSFSDESGSICHFQDNKKPPPRYWDIRSFWDDITLMKPHLSHSSFSLNIQSSGMGCPENPSHQLPLDKDEEIGSIP
ncbi:hypothetical protein AVEN_130637-1 [Araneus ventricosus]|uniref:Uncharacterized protein n=1 Tax=Araneus ventricosus TaxID=182803 RepID=A0A4Y2TI13_ARAVE|nr:hypothetical protein AVEN_130637-1 [Araneus ventricosus]